MSQPLPFPKHFDSDSDLLRFVIVRAALYSLNSKEIKAVAAASGLRADTITRSICAGKFSTRAANRIEKACGRDYIRWEWLVNPRISLENGSIV